MNIIEEFERVLLDAAAEVGTDLSDTITEVRAYAGQRALHLSTITGEPGYLEALRAERDSVALKAALDVTADADAWDARLVGVIGGALAIVAKAISVEYPAEAEASVDMPILDMKGEDDNIEENKIETETGTPS